MIKSNIGAVCAFILIVQCAFAQCAFARVVGGDRIMDQNMIENLCALTFDDGPSRNTGALLDMLADYGIKATFFLLGNQVRQRPDLALRIQDEGHEIGNHSWSHPNLRNISLEALKNELYSTDAYLRQLGVTPLYLRPPYGAYDDRVIQIANDLGVDLILWSLDSRDWKSLPDDYAKLRSTRGTVYEDGDLRGIFLFHDTHKSTVDDLPRIIANLRAGGCDRFVTVSEYLAGITDPEPPLLMTRHAPERLAPKRPPAPRVPVAPVAPVAPAPKAYASGTGPEPLARCSRPWNFVETPKQEPFALEEAHAAASMRSGG